MRTPAFHKSPVRHAYLNRAQQAQIPLWSINPADIHANLYPGAVIGGVILYFVTKVNKMLVKELIRDAYRKRTVKTRCSLMEIPPAQILEDVFGTSLTATLSQQDFREAQDAVYETW